MLRGQQHRLLEPHVPHGNRLARYRLGLTLHQPAHLLVLKHAQVLPDGLVLGTFAGQRLDVGVQGVQLLGEFGRRQVLGRTAA